MARQAHPRHPGQSPSSAQTSQVTRRSQVTHRSQGIHNAAHVYITPTSLQIAARVSLSHCRKERDADRLVKVISFF